MFLQYGAGFAIKKEISCGTHFFFLPHLLLYFPSFSHAFSHTKKTNDTNHRRRSSPVTTSPGCASVPPWSCPGYRCPPGATVALGRAPMEELGHGGVQ